MFLQGVCRTEVEQTGYDYVVKFTEFWDATQFHAFDDPVSGKLQYTWSFLVDSTGAVVAQPPVGNFPPQHVK